MFNDPVLQEQLEIQLRSQYKWQADYTWVYWPFLLMTSSIFCLGLFALITNILAGEILFGLLFGLGAMFVGGFVTAALWGGYKTALEMADKLREAETQGR